MDKVKQVKALRSGKGLQYLLDAAKRIFDNPISISDINHRWIVFTDDKADDPVWNEMTSTVTFSMKAQELLAKEYFAEYMAHADKYLILRNDEIKYARMAGYIFNRENVKIGIVSMYECYTPFDEESRAAFKLFTAAITGELRKNKHFLKIGRVFHKDIINSSLDRVLSNCLYGR